MAEEFNWVRFTKRVFHSIREDAIGLHAAALTFFALFSLLPLLVLSYLFYNRLSEDVALEFLVAASDTLGSKATNMLIRAASDFQVTDISPLGYAVGIILVIYAMTRFMYFMQKSMNFIWQAHPTKSWAKIELQHRLISFASIVVFILLVTVISLREVVLIALKSAIGLTAAKIVLFVGSAVLIYLIIGTLYTFVPDRKVNWRDVQLGTVFTMICFWLGFNLIQEVISYSFVNSIYATISGVLITLVLIYMLAHIFYIGAEIAKTYTFYYGSLANSREKLYKRKRT